MFTLSIKKKVPLYINKNHRSPITCHYSQNQSWSAGRFPMVNVMSIPSSSNFILLIQRGSAVSMDHIAESLWWWWNKSLSIRHIAITVGTTNGSIKEQLHIVKFKWSSNASTKANGSWSRLINLASFLVFLVVVVIVIVIAGLDDNYRSIFTFIKHHLCVFIPPILRPWVKRNFVSPKVRQLTGCVIEW